MHKQWLLPQIFQHMYKCEEKEKKTEKMKIMVFVTSSLANPIFAEIPI